MSKTIWSLLAAVLVALWTAPSIHCAPAGAPADTCAACHEKQVKSMTDSAMHASVHAKAGVDTCAGCHDETALKKTHAKMVPGEKKFVKARRYSQEFCLKCHGTVTDLAKRTAKSKVLTDTLGRTVNPHDIPKTPKHAKVDECANCHKEHKTKPEALQYCTGCHHTGEFACSKCHS
jgi:hypothetical protein